MHSPVSAVFGLFIKDLNFRLDSDQGIHLVKVVLLTRRADGFGVL